jgi:hypothetical protein
MRIAQAIVAADSDYRRTIAAGKAAVSVLREGLGTVRLHLSKKELQWLDRIEAELDALPTAEEVLREEICESHGGLFDCASYGLSTA